MRETKRGNLSLLSFSQTSQATSVLINKLYILDLIDMSLYKEMAVRCFFFLNPDLVSLSESLKLSDLLSLSET